MQVSNLEFKEIESNDSFMGFVNCVVEKSMKVNGIAVHAKKDGTGIRILWPIKNGNKPACYPLTKEINQDIIKQIEANLIKMGFYGYGEKAETQ